MNFADRLKEARKHRGLTQAELAEKCGLATGTIQQYELGKRNPTKKNIHKIAEALNLGYSFSPNGNVHFYAFVDTVSNNKYVENENFNEHQTFSLKTQELQSKIIKIFQNLNNEGQQKALEQIELISKIQEYLK